MVNASPNSDQCFWPISQDLNQFEGLFFDLDGTLVNTMSLHGRAYAAVFADLGHELSLDAYLANVGAPARIAIPAFAAAAGMGQLAAEQVGEIHAAKKQKFAELLSYEPGDVLVTAQLLKLFFGKKPLGLVSSGNRGGVDAILTTMGWTDCFDIVISGDDVVYGKPHPEPYLLAGKALGVEVQKCIVFEDTEAGIKSGLAAGMNVIDVTQPGRIILAASLSLRDTK